MKRSIPFLATACLAVLSCTDAGLSSPGLTSVSTGADVIVPGVWVNVAAPNVIRFTSGVAAGPDGRIYAAGGQISATPPATATAEVYDPATNTWSMIAPMPTLRYLHASARGGDGRIYEIAGAVLASGAQSNTVVAYNPATNAWSSVAPLPGVGRHLPGATTGLDGRIYVAGGRVASPSGLVATSLAAVYNPTTGVWTPIAPLPTPLYGPVMATGPNGLIYAIAGTAVPSPLSTAVFAYDPATNTWTTVASLPGPRMFSAAVTGSDGHIYVFGGRDGALVTVTNVQAYDVVANAWTTVPSMNVPRVAHGGALGSDGRIYAVGGGATFSGGVNLATEAYGPNQAPTASAGADVTVECAGGGANVALNGSGSTDPDDGIASYEWFEGASSIATGPTPTVHLSVGTHTIVLRVTDNGALSDEDVVVVTVSDTQAPTVNLTLLTNNLWPPNHEMVKVASGVSVSDGCDGSPALTVSVSSNEPVDGLGDGDTAPDWNVVASGDGTFDVYVRAERSGKGSGRVYTISATATDASGNTTTQTATVTVPKSQGKS